MAEAKAKAGYLAVVAAALLWSTVGVAARVAYAWGLDPAEVTFFRAFTGFLTAAVVAAAGGRLAAVLRAGRRRLGRLALYGLVGIGAFYLSYFSALERLPLAAAAVLLYTAPVFVALLGRWLLGEPFGAARGAALALSVAGVALVAGPWDVDAARLSTAGVMAGLAAGLTYALFSVFGKVAVRDLDPEAVVIYSLGFGSACLLAALPPGRLLTLEYGAREWLLMLVSGAALTYLPYLLYTHGLRRVPATSAAIVATVEPVAAAAWGWVIFAEALGPAQIAGGLLVLAAAVIVQARRPAPSPAAPDGPAPEGAVPAASRPEARRGDGGRGGVLAEGTLAER